MNENLNLVEILKNCPKGTKLYSLIHGEVYLSNICEDDTYPIEVLTELKVEKYFMGNGRYKFDYTGKCVLFPSIDQRDWSKFKVSVEKFDPKTLKPFDKVLVEEWGKWTVDFFSYISTDSETPYYCIGHFADIIIPYNDETKHLVGTSDDPDEKYIWWVDN